MKKTIAKCTLLLALVTNITFADLVSDNDVSSQLNEDIRLYTNISDKITVDMAPIKTPQDLYRFSHLKSPLDKLTPNSKQHFIESITFNERGITGFGISELEYELTPTEIYKVLALIGYQNFTYKFQNARVETSLDSLLLANKNLVDLLNKNKNKQTDVNKDNTSNMRMSGFLEGYRCESKGTCELDSSRACTSNC